MPDLFSSNPHQTSKEAGQLLPEGVLVQEYKSHKIRTAHLEDGTEIWVVSDIIAAITQSKDPSAYWRKVKQRLKNEGNDAVTNCHPMQIKDALGRWQTVDAMTREQILRMLESIPSKKAEPFKQWIARLANERIEEIKNPDLAVKRGYEGYLKKGMSPEKAMKRARGVLARNNLTEQWKRHGVKTQREYALLTDRESKGTFGKTTGEMKKERGLERADNLRNSMSVAELIAQEASDTAISLLIDQNNPQGFEENGREVDKGSTVGAGVMEMFKRVLVS